MHAFLVGLDGTFEQVRGEILRKEPIPNQEECYAQIGSEVAGQIMLKEDREISKNTTMVS